MTIQSVDSRSANIEWHEFSNQYENQFNRIFKPFGYPVHDTGLIKQNNSGKPTSVSVTEGSHRSFPECLEHSGKIKDFRPSHMSPLYQLIQESTTLQMTISDFRQYFSNQAVKTTNCLPQLATHRQFFICIEIN